MSPWSLCIYVRTDVVVNFKVPVIATVCIYTLESIVLGCCVLSIMAYHCAKGVCQTSSLICVHCSSCWCSDSILVKLAVFLNCLPTVVSLKCWFYH